MIIPSVSSNVVKDFPIAAKQMINSLKPKEEDVIIVVGADSPEKAENGALTAVWTFLTGH